MSEIKTATITITTEPEAGQMKQKLSPDANPAVLQMYELVIERCTDGARVEVFLSLYMPAKLVAAYGGTSALMPGMRAGDVLGGHGMRFSMSRLDLDWTLTDLPGGPVKLFPQEIAAVQQALRTLLGETEEG